MENEYNDFMKYLQSLYSPSSSPTTNAANPTPNNQMMNPMMMNPMMMNPMMMNPMMMNPMMMNPMANMGNPYQQSSMANPMLMGAMMNPMMTSQNGYNLHPLYTQYQEHKKKLREEEAQRIKKSMEDYKELVTNIASKSISDDYLLNGIKELLALNILPEILLQDDKSPDPALHTSEYLAMVKIKDEMLSAQVEELGREFIREAIDERVSWLLYEKNKITVHSIIANPSHSIAEEVYDTFIKEFVQDITIECLAERATIIRLGYYVLPVLEDNQIPVCIRAIVHECESDLASQIIVDNIVNDVLPSLISDICNTDIKNLEGKQTDQNQTFAMDQLVIRVGIEQLISMLSDISKHEEDAAILEGEKEKLAFDEQIMNEAEAISVKHSIASKPASIMGD